MRRGPNVKYTHDRKELARAMKQMREFRHIENMEMLLQDYLGKYGREVTEVGIFDVVKQAVVSDGDPTPEKWVYCPVIGEYFNPDDCIEYLAREHGFSCVLCGNLQFDKEEWGYYRDVYSGLGWFGTGLNFQKSQRGRPIPLCDGCIESFLRKARRLGLDNWMDRDRYDYFLRFKNYGECWELRQKEFELFCLEWMNSLLEKAIKIAKARGKS